MIIIIIKKQNLQIKLYDKFLLIYINYRNKKLIQKIIVSQYFKNKIKIN